MATLVSLPEHLRQTLLALLEVPPPPILTDDLATQLRPYVTPPGADPSLNLSPAPAPGAKPTIPNSLLSQVSKHVRSVRCRTALEANNLDPRDYEMIALLAGVRTISSATADPPETADTSRQNTAKQWAEDRRALTAVVNGLFSIGGVGFAVWYAAGSAGWGEEWRALLALFAGLVVAASEGILFVIWQDRIEKRRTQDKARREHKARLREKARDKGKTCTGGWSTRYPDPGCRARIRAERKRRRGRAPLHSAGPGCI
ncbi:hypothetical protein DACRYDRAFT_93924 [Dacryopinax primogenitus]|uniref:Endoplasmic reticulum-based factor for assembly of V-ATPase n=1 Tax=Dacryopinax primogenitus (strain DJM 731) TaxID=1858805 RepID=M5G028_DACPD|nr:uncharacterized protein DACRYDRAFT_93924 [Dacryopinax primogenitus]EJU03616.1 hypothetical protein DACRYDRAFT_93924 [Dacryopinax primogenitus]